MRLRALSACVLFGASSLTSVARADDAADAKRLFEEGRKALAEGRVGPACESFAEAKRLAPEACGVVQNLAMCRQQQGRYLDASNEFDALAACGAKTAQSDRVKFADDQRAALRPKLAFLSIVSREGPKVVSLYLDGVSNDAHLAAPDARPRALEPGKHRVEVEREGCTMERLEVTLKAGETQSLVLPLTCGAVASTQTTTTAPGPVAAPVVAPPAEERSRPVRWQIPVGLSAIAVGGLAAIGSLAPCGIIARRQRDDKQTDAAESTATVCTSLAIAGGAVLVAGVVILLTTPSAKPARAQAYGIAPHLAGPKDFGLSAYLQF